IIIVSSVTVYGQNSQKDSLLYEVSEYEKTVNKAATLFLNKELSTAERIKAMEPYAIVYDEKHVKQFKNIILDDKEQPEIRATALSKIYQFVLTDERLGTLAIEWLGDPQAPAILKQKAFQLAVLYKVFQRTKNDATRFEAIRALGFYKEAREKLVNISRDASEKEEFREAALEALDAGDKAVIPTCPTSLLPLIEVQINNTPSNHDDYGSTTAYTACRARVVNYLNSQGGNNFPNGVPIVIRNPFDKSNPSFSLSFSATGGTSAGEARIFSTLPGEGTWLTFYVKGTLTSAIDKSSIIEIAAQGACTADAVLARKALMIPPVGSIPISSDGPRVVLEIGSVSTLDDYVTWAPKLCRIRWLTSNPPPQVDITYQNSPAPGSFIVSPASFTEAAGSTLTITLRNMNATGPDKRLQFADGTLAAGHTASNDALTLTLQNDGAWVNFYIAGNYPNASIRDKDAVMEVRDAGTGLLLSREGVMVRIRKNANTLTSGERDRFLNALNKLNSSSKFNDYIDFVKTHSRSNINDTTKSMVSHRQAHSGSAFLPWHRAFVLHFERLLQAADPSVALPYWKFDAAAPNIFTQNFMGSDEGDNTVKLSGTNPIRTWSMSQDGVPAPQIMRGKMKAGKNGAPQNMPGETDILALGNKFSAFKGMEIGFHNLAHSAWPAPSWLLLPELAPRDPLFFPLHCNVDRVWAEWQWVRNRYTTSDSQTYDLQGSYANPANPNLKPAYIVNNKTQVITTDRTLGQYADDTMWPWNNVTGGTGTVARPGTAVLTPLPATLGTTLPDKPAVKSVIDYLNITSPVPGDGLDYAYDNFFPYD
ncbi:MAG TPA: tyrosinase family protein, partial [Chitinophagaceae bacterium]